MTNSPINKSYNSYEYCIHAFMNERVCVYTYIYIIFIGNIYWTLTFYFLIFKSNVESIWKWRGEKKVELPNCDTVGVNVIQFLSNNKVDWKINLFVWMDIQGVTQWTSVSRKSESILFWTTLSMKVVGNEKIKVNIYIPILVVQYAVINSMH